MSTSILVVSVLGLAAIDAYLAYNIYDMLSIGQAMWKQAFAYQLSQHDAEVGYSSAQNASVPSSCSSSESFAQRRDRWHPLSDIDIR